MSRAERKADHIRHALVTGQMREHGFEDVMFVHQSLPNTSIKNINLETNIGTMNVKTPMFINAMTGGGGDKTYAINKQLASVANECGLPIALGSQMSAIKDQSEVNTYKVVREVNRNGIIFANLGSEATSEQALRAVDMVGANALQIHLNVIQELVMPEGDRNFINAIKRIEEIVKVLQVPVIVKETGFGISKEAATLLKEVGVSIIDVSGFGGTNFSKIENERRQHPMSYFNDWGITTAAAIAEVKHGAPTTSIISSGGIQSAMDIAKSIALGASAVGMAGFLLSVLMNDGEEQLLNEIKLIHEDLTYIMVALGAETIPDLQKSKIVIKGNTHHWLNERGISTKKYSS
ncbi:type 2 isopentenyl-diphosphate Delta-isomerase [Sutcliffiella sp. NC1]|uniref:type 2 isopentenyl-diphosphate Delta-isomerase n=1 Tax=Sutcliffiella sp. NC1 TaxID=3004096 RepID=UPI0022DDB03B|nr:type 2 isopentenyl-diphosphate Delta-isomerase [Sutcliffiella sp. NC1]WBL13499.1 type 2 isopentenyl-diphosphate Delta-isomerase [Sutcliffiella sp. NC1]